MFTSNFCKSNFISEFLKKWNRELCVLFVTLCLFSSCNVVKRVNQNEHLLTDAEIIVNDKKSNKEELNDLLNQRPNSTLLGYPLRLHIYNLARPNIDSIIEKQLLSDSTKVARRKRWLSQKQLNKKIESKRNFNNWIKRTGEEPIIIDSSKTLKSINNLEKYFYNNGWFDRKVDYEIIRKKNKRGSVKYLVKTGAPYTIDSISRKIETPILDSLYASQKTKALYKINGQFRSSNLTDERERIVEQFRNSGVFFFSQDYVRYNIDTTYQTKKVHVDLLIGNREIRNQDAVSKVPFKIWKVERVNIITDDTYENEGLPFNDSTEYDGYNLYAHHKIKYKPKALTDAVFIKKGAIFRDIDRTYTYRYINELQSFRYPTIDYIANEADTSLTANIYLKPRKKYGLGVEVNVSQSNIQSVGLSGNLSLMARNVFKGAENLELSFLGAIGASRDGAGDENQFFDINELGADIKLTLPRLFLPFNTDKIVPKFMSPTTRISLGFTSQTNIGLDKQTVNGIINYRWFPSTTVTNSLDLFNSQYVRNLNPENYFSVYQTSFDRLNDIATEVYPTPDEFLDNGNLIESEADNFIDLVLQDDDFLQSNPDEFRDVNNINERKDRLTENNLILATSFSYQKDKRENVFDNDFSIFRTKIEVAGNLLSTISNVIGLEKNSTNRYELFNVAFSQYVKTEFDYIKHWSIGRRGVLAMRNFFGIAIPYGNSTNIPFARSFFAGGPNDNRAWTAFNLGPGSSNSQDEFNEANLKIALSLEYRFNLIGKFNGALFTDIGNIWNALDDVDDPASTFDGIKSLEDIAIGTGFGIRYDFGFFVGRFDIGFKTYNPALELGNRWFKEYNFSNAVYNIGINYPF